MPAFQSLPVTPRSLLFFSVTAFCLLFLTYQTLPPRPITRSHDVSSEASGKLARLPQGRFSDIFNSTLGFEKIFAISLPERTDHRDTITLTSALTGFEVDFIDGVRTDTISDKALPPIAGVTGGAKGAWRAHINALQQIVRQGYGSALIAEEDFDWDIRLKTQLLDLSIATNGVLSRYNGEHIPHAGAVPGHTLSHADSLSYLQSKKKSFRTPQSPYGDGWDVLWLGNCGMRASNPTYPWQTLLITQENDPTTVPVNQYYHWDWADNTHIYKQQANHTRIYLSQPVDTMCTIAYAVSQKGARKILLELGLERADRAFDLLLQNFCQGGGPGNLAEPHACWGVLPGIFSSYLAAGPENKDSDIGDFDASRMRPEGHSANMQRSVRMNARKLLTDPVPEIVDQYPYAEGT